jgi:hypothetical protein
VVAGRLAVTTLSVSNPVSVTAISVTIAPDNASAATVEVTVEVTAEGSVRLNGLRSRSNRVAVAESVAVGGGVLVGGGAAGVDAGAPAATRSRSGVAGGSTTAAAGAALRSWRNDPASCDSTHQPPATKSVMSRMAATPRSGERLLVAATAPGAPCQRMTRVVTLSRPPRSSTWLTS